jgi:hypothetical protein
MSRIISGKLMNHSIRIQLTVLLAVFLLSSITMVWLFWRFPIRTSLAAIVLVATLFQCARISRIIDSGASMLDSENQ